MARTLTAEEFEELYRATAPELFGYVRRRAGVDAEDLVAEVFVTAWRRRSDLPPAVLRRAWLFGIARKLMLAEVRRSVRDADVVAHLSTQPPAGAPGARAGDSDVVAAAMARLSPTDRELIELTEWERLTPGELAVALGVRPGTVRVRLHRARRALASDPELQAIVSVRPNRPRERSSSVLPAGVAEG